MLSACASLAPGPGNSAAAFECGDYSCDNQLSASDVFSAFNFLVETVRCSPTDSLDIDEHFRLSVRDAVWISRYLSTGDPAPHCDSTDAELLPQPGPNYFLLCKPTVTECTDRCRAYIELLNYKPLYGAAIYVIIKVDGIPVSGTISVEGPFSAGTGGTTLHSIEPGLFSAGLAMYGAPVPPGRRRIATFMGEDNAWLNKPISIQLVSVDSLQYDSAIARHPAAVDDQLGLWQINDGMVECPILLSGDADMSGGMTSSDIILLVNYVFKSGSPPRPCSATGDVNCDLSVNSADVIGMVNHVFKGGPEPCDVCTVHSTPWGCF